MLSDEREQLGGVAAQAHDVEPSALEQARQPLAKQDVVVRQRHPRPARSHAVDYRLAFAYGAAFARGWGRR
jgi:hypothetical protein